MKPIPRLQILKIYLWLTGIFLLLWWPLSHWFYAEWYHALFGFENPAQYAHNSLVKIIGLTGFCPIFLMFFAALNPIRNRDALKVFIITGFMVPIVYFYLIQTHGFPPLEYFNAAMYAGTALILIILYPKTEGENNDHA
jgi:hypothetical protein